MSLDRVNRSSRYGRLSRHVTDPEELKVKQPGQLIGGVQYTSDERIRRE